MGVRPLPSFGVLVTPPPWVWGLWAGQGGPRCLCSLARSCSQIAAVPRPSRGDIPACPGDSPGDTGTCCGGERSRGGLPQPKGRGTGFRGGCFRGRKPSPGDAPAEAAVPGQAGPAESGGCRSSGAATRTPPASPALATGLACPGGWGLHCPAQMRPPPGAGRVQDRARLHLAAAAPGQGTSGAQGRAFSGICSLPRSAEELGELLPARGEIRRRGALGAWRAAGRGVPPLKTSDPKRGTRSRDAVGW